MKLRHFVCLLALVAILPTFVGCGDARDDRKDLPAGSSTVTAKQTVRGWLQSVAASGQLDSGAGEMIPKVEEMAKEGIDIQADFDELMKTAEGAPLQEKANQLLEKIPE